MRISILRIMWMAAWGVAVAAVPCLAELRCELKMQDGASGAACLDPAALKGRAVSLPSNVTRIGRDGLALCARQHSSSQASDIAYVIDNSNSMDAWGFWIDPSSGDTSFYIPNCANSVSGTKVAFRKRHFGASGTDSSWDTLVRISSSRRPSSVSGKNCLEANDPYSMRAEVVRVAMRYQARLDSNSQAGMVQFYSKVQQRSGLRVLQGDGLSRLLDSTGLYDAGSGTAWTPPLDTALGWLESSANSVKAVIVVSDGEPTDGSAYRRLLRGTSSLPKIYGVFLGSGIADVAEMDSLTAITGGQYWIVPPSRPDSLQSVIRSIVGDVMSTETPGTTALTNLSNGQSSTALSLSQGRDGVFHLLLDSVVALDTGRNAMRLVSSWTDERGVARSDTSTFVLDVGAPAATASGAIAGDALFASACVDASRLSFLGAAFQAVDYVSESEGAFAVRLDAASILPQPVSVQVREKAWGDVEALRLAAIDAASGEAYVASEPLAVPRPRAGRSGDGAVQAADGLDTLYAKWCYPRDARDCAEDTVEVRALQSPYVRWTPRRTTGPAGSLVLDASLPGQAGQTVKAVVYRRGKIIGSATLRKTADSLFSDTVNFRQGGAAAGGDTLGIADPSILDSLVAQVEWTPAGVALDSFLRDTARISRLPLSLVFSADSSDPQGVHMALSGAMADVKGNAAVLLPSLTESVKLLPAGAHGWTGEARLADRLSESLDSVLVEGVFVDPVFGDSAWARIRLASPWYPGSIAVSPDTADPRKGDSVTVVVRDRDPDSSVVDSVSVTVGALSWVLKETGRSTGEYRLRLPAAALAPDWSAREPHHPWSLTVTYRDPLHLQDVSSGQLILSFSVPPVRVAVHTPLADRPAGTVERSDGATGLVLIAQPDTVFRDGGPSAGGESSAQGIAIRTWETARICVYIYDQLGISVNSWSGLVSSSDVSKGALYLLRWDGRDKAGEVAGAGVYLVRVVRYDADGRYRGNDILRIGLR